MTRGIPSEADEAVGQPEPEGPRLDLAEHGFAEPEFAEPGREAVNTGRRKSHTVLWAAIGAAVVLAALFAVVVSARPSSEVQGRSPLLGRPAPAISGAGLAGGHYSLSQFRTKWVLVNFMATWCGPCRQEVPQLLEFSKQHPTGAVVLTVAYDPTNVAQLRSFLAQNGARWPAVDDTAASVAYGVQGLPSSFLVAPGGTVIAYIEGEVEASQLDSYIARASATGVAPSAP